MAVPGAALLAWLVLGRDGDGAPPGAVGFALWILVSVGGLYLSLLAAVHLLVVRRRGVTWRQIGFRPAAPRWYAIAGAILVAWWITGLVVFQAFDLWGEAMSHQRRALLPAPVALPLLVLIGIAIGPLAALLEETLFRGLFYQWLRRHMPLAAAAVVSGALFALVHLNVVVPGGMAGAAMTAEIFAIGIALAYLFAKCGSLWPGTVLHAVNNLAVLGYLAAS